MILAQGRFWRAHLPKSQEGVTLSILRDSLPPELVELKDVRIDVPLGEWHRLVKQLRADRKLVGGILLDFAKTKDHLSAAIASDRLFSALQQVVADATLGLVEEGLLTLVTTPRKD
jgi:hypothetical protein